MARFQELREIAQFWRHRFQMIHKPGNGIFKEAGLPVGVGTPRCAPGGGWAWPGPAPPPPVLPDPPAPTYPQPAAGKVSTEVCSEVCSEVYSEGWSWRWRRWRWRPPRACRRPPRRRGSEGGRSSRAQPPLGSSAGG